MAQNYLNRGSSGTLSLFLPPAADTNPCTFRQVFQGRELSSVNKTNSSSKIKAVYLCAHSGVSLAETARDGGANLLWTASANPFMRCMHGGYAHCSVNGCCSFLFISITSHQNSSPSEVATVPLAIKIVLGHATPVCDSAVGNKSSGSSGNDADSRVVNLERCRREREL